MLALALALAAGALAGLSAPRAAAAPSAPSGGLQLRLAGIAEVELINEDGNYCLDANDSGSTAGKNGDKVQLWKCTGNANQFWSPGAQDSAGFETLFNDEYQSKCLNANDSPSLGDGSKVQLWGCGGVANDMWDVTNWADCVQNSMVSAFVPSATTTVFPLGPKAIASMLADEGENVASVLSVAVSHTSTWPEESPADSYRRATPATRQDGNCRQARGICPGNPSGVVRTGNGNRAGTDSAQPETLSFAPES